MFKRFLPFLFAAFLPFSAYADGCCETCIDDYSVAECAAQNVASAPAPDPTPVPDPTPTPVPDEPIWTEHDHDLPQHGHDTAHGHSTYAELMHGHEPTLLPHTHATAPARKSAPYWAAMGAAAGRIPHTGDRLSIGMGLASIGGTDAAAFGVNLKQQNWRFSGVAMQSSGEVGVSVGAAIGLQ